LCLTSPARDDRLLFASSLWMMQKSVFVTSLLDQQRLNHFSR
jgi:hypothetical protein